jgi:hypothetical protein
MAKAWLVKRAKIDGKWLVRTPFIGNNGVLTDKVHLNGTTVHAVYALLISGNGFGCCAGGTVWTNVPQTRASAVCRSPRRADIGSYRRWTAFFPA